MNTPAMTMMRMPTGMLADVVTITRTAIVTGTVIPTIIQPTAMRTSAPVAGAITRISTVMPMTIGMTIITIMAMQKIAAPVAAVTVMTTTAIMAMPASMTDRG